MSESEPASPRLQSRYRGRFAPSPSGSLHRGSLLAALAGYLRARSNDGEWLLRIDDIDPDRSTPSAADEILRTLEHFGLFWDREVVFQSLHLERYRHALNQLQHRGLVYGCECSRKDLASDGSGTAVYPGHCRSKRLLDRGRSHALRLVTAGATITFTDRLQGTMRHDVSRETGDFVIRRRDGAFAYHLATVVDDADAEVSEVMRGVDLLDSTPRQIYLQQLLHFPVPAYCHVPILVGSDGDKLSKQNFASPVKTHEPAKTLCDLLRLLRQRPPKELAEASTSEILKWAIAHWDVDRLVGLKTITVE